MPNFEVPFMIPAWLTTEFMENALKKPLKDDQFKIIEFEVKRAAAVEDHYGSQMLRYNLKDQNNKKFSVVVKTAPLNAISDMMDVSVVFDEEIFAYSEVLPAVDSLLKKAYPGHERLWPECFYYENQPNCTLILEDLRLDGFTLANRFEGLDLNHGVIVVKALAKLHAGSLAMLQEDPEVLKGHEDNLWSKKTDILQNILKYPFVGLIKDLPNWPEFEKKDYYVEKLKNLEDVVLDKVFEAWKVNEKKLNVCLHGDSWANNFMFRYDAKGTPEAVKLVDFQINGYGSPVMDLQYFIFSSVKGELKFDKLHYLLQRYCEAFQQTVDSLGVNVRYDVENVEKDLKDKGFWGFIILCSIYPLVTAPKEEMFDPNDYFANQGPPFEKTFRREEVRQVLRRAFDYYDSKGLL